MLHGEKLTDANDSAESTAFSIVHDFRNILSVIDSGLRLAELNAGDPHKVGAFIAGAREGVARGLKLASQLLSFAQKRDAKLNAADLNTLLKNLESFLQYSAGPSVRVLLECSPMAPKCLVDASQFSSAILNLVVNARDAMSERGGEVRINTSSCGNRATPEPSLDGAYVRVSVEDTGSGMPDYIAQRMFEPFFTTKGKKGTGLGGPQVGQFMHSIGGHVTVTSEPGRGTTVDLYFPTVEHGTPAHHARY